MTSTSCSSRCAIWPEASPQSAGRRLSTLLAPRCIQSVSGRRSFGSELLFRVIRHATPPPVAGGSSGHPLVGPDRGTAGSSGPRRLPYDRDPFPSCPERYRPAIRGIGGQGCSMEGCHIDAERDPRPGWGLQQRSTRRGERLLPCLYNRSGHIHPGCMTAARANTGQALFARHASRSRPRCSCAPANSSTITTKFNTLLASLEAYGLLAIA